MRTLTKLSLLANVILAVLVCWLMRPARFNQASPAHIPFDSTIPAAAVESQPAPIPAPSPTQEAPPPFRWSQLESSDYRAYIANLRNIGCPEQTIHDIVAADLDSAYYARRRQVLEQKSAAVVFADSPLPDAVAAEMRRLGNEESALVTGLLTTQPGVADMAAANPGPQPATPPLAWANPAIQPGSTQKPSIDAVTPPGKAQLSAASSSPPVGNRLMNDPVAPPAPSQQAEPATKLPGIERPPMNAVGQTTQEQVSDPYQDPAAAALRAKWALARLNADYSLRGLIGRQGYLDYIDETTMTQ